MLTSDTDEDTEAKALPTHTAGGKAKTSAPLT